MLTQEEIKEITHKPNRRHVYLATVDSKGKEHMNFISIIYPVENVEEEAQKTMDIVFPEYKVNGAVLCECPICRDRWGNMK